MNKLNRYYISQNISIDNALSMNQILHQIVNEIKGIVDFINNLELRANEYTDEQIRLLNERLQAQLTTLEDTLKTYTNDKIDEYNAEIINPQLIEIRNTIDTINRTINERIDREVGIINRHVNSVESTLNKKIDDTKEYLEELIKKGNQLVYSSISGRKIPIQDTLFEMGNALKQILSYNWNSIDEFKSFSVYDFQRNVNDFKKEFDPTHDQWATKGINYNDVPLTDTNKCYVYLKYTCDSDFDSLNIGDTIDVSYGYGDSEDVFSGGGGPLFIEKIGDKLVRADLASINLDNHNYAFIGLNNGFQGPLMFDDLSQVILYYGDENTYNITFNSIKLAMQELNVNWNALSFTGVNTFYELNETEKMFDTTGVKSDYFANDKYKVVHNNFKSDFFKSNIN